MSTTTTTSSSATSGSSAIATQQQDPINLDQLYDGLTSPAQSSEAKAQALQVLYTVAHHPAVKADLITKPSVLRAIANGIVQRNKAFHAVRWSNLAILGELCRREPRGDVDNLLERNAIAAKFVATLAKISWFAGALRDLKAEGNGATSESERGQTAAMASDLLKCMPEQREIPEGLTSPIFDAKLGEEDMGDGFVWTKDQRDACKDLLYIDPSETKQLKTLPFIVRSSNLECANCRSKSETVLNRCVQCKAAFYCNGTCQKAHWASVHKTVCGAWKKTRDPQVFPVLFFETRSFLYDQRPESMSKLDFYAFFSQYSPKYR